MEKGRLCIPKDSKAKIAAIICGAVRLVLCAAALGITVVLFSYLAMGSRLKVPFGIGSVVSLITTIQSAYAFYGIAVSRRTLKHIAWAWMMYPVIPLMDNLMIDGIDMYDINAVSVVRYTVITLACLAMGIVLLMYEHGRLSDKRILLYLSGGAFLFAVIVFSVQYIWYFTQTFKLIAAAGAVVSVLITIVSNFIVYAPPFFLAHSMQNKYYQYTGEHNALS